MDLEVIKSKSVKLLVTPEQHRKFKHWHDVSRWVFNQALAFIRDYQTCEELGIKKPSWMDIKKTFTQTLPIWTKDVPFQIKGIAVKEAVEAYWATLKAHKGKKGKISFKFRSWKDPVQSCFILKTAISDNGIYPKISGKDLKFFTFPKKKGSETLQVYLITRPTSHLPNAKHAEFELH